MYSSNTKQSMKTKSIIIKSMSITDIIQNVIYNEVKDLYFKKISLSNIDELDDKEIIELVNYIYNHKRQEIERKIKNKIMSEIPESKYPGDKYVNNLIEDIIDDEEMAISKVKTEIQLYQKYKKNIIIHFTYFVYACFCYVLLYKKKYGSSPFV